MNKKWLVAVKMLLTSWLSSSAEIIASMTSTEYRIFFSVSDDAFEVRIARSIATSLRSSSFVIFVDARDCCK